MSTTLKKEESEKKKLEPASSSLDVLTEGLKRSSLPQIRKLDGTIANARWMQKEVTDATDRCSLEVERVISTMVGEEEEDNTKKGERERGQPTGQVDRANKEERYKLLIWLRSKKNLKKI